MYSTADATIALTEFNGRYADTSHHTDKLALVRALLRHRDYFSLISQEIGEATKIWDEEAAEDARKDDCQLAKYPLLRECALHVAYDNGMINRDCTEGQFLADQDSVLASVDDADLARLEQWLSTLTEGERETLATGEQTEQDEIASDCPVGGPDSRPLIRILDDIFEHPEKEI